MDDTGPCLLCGRHLGPWEIVMVEIMMGRIQAVMKNDQPVGGVHTACMGREKNPDCTLCGIRIENGEHRADHYVEGRMVPYHTLCAAKAGLLPEV